MSELLLEVINLKKYFPVTEGLLRKEVATVKAVDGVSFSLKQGEILGIVGESGSGKSTAARAAIRLIEPTSGQVFFAGKDLSGFHGAQMQAFRRDVQIIFQDPYASLNPRKTILDSVSEGLVYHGLVKNEEEKRQKVAAVLEQVGLSPEAMFRYPHQFSGGQQQRICIGRAIAMRPKLIVCDEAVSALDVSIQAQILNLLKDLKEQLGLSYLFISHDLSVVRYFCDRIVVLYLGKVMETSPTEALFSHPQHPYTKALLSAAPKEFPEQMRERLPLKGEIPSPLNPPSGCPFRTRCPFAQPECAFPPPVQSLDHGRHRYWCILPPS